MSEGSGEAPSGVRLWVRYTQERFPIPGALLYAGTLFVCAWLLAGRFGGASEAEPLRAAVGALVAFGLLLRLRVVDEHKDFDKDREAYPDRLLSRGLISLAQLRRVFVVVLLLEGLGCAWLGGPALVAWFGLNGYLYLMHVEFFFPAFLETHIGWYLVTHQVLMPLTAGFAVATRCDPRGLQAADGVEVGALMIGTMCATMTYEVARKTWPPEREHASAASYTREWGAPLTVLANQLIAWVGAAAFGWLLLGTGATPAIWVVYGLTGLHLLAADLAFLATRSAGRSKWVGVAGALHMLTLFVGAAVGFS